MNFFRKLRRSKDSSKKCADGKEDKDKTHKEHKGKEHEITPETKKLYYTAEFNSLGDVTKDHFMRKEEFTRLMQLLGFPNGTEAIDKIWSDKGKEDGSLMSVDEYIEVMMDDSVESLTNSWRKLFAFFDPDGNALADKSEVVKGLKHIGIDVTPDMRKKLDQMDTNKDGHISYEEFLKAQLKQ